MANLQIPITINFDPRNIIGYAEIDEEKLPEKPDYHFAISGQILESEEDGVPAKIKLTGLGLVPDVSFKPLVAFVSIDKGEPGGDKTAECLVHKDESGKIVIDDVKLEEEQPKEEILPYNIKSQEQSFEAFWQFREDVLNRQLEFYRIPIKISLKTDLERSLFTETLKEISDEEEINSILKHDIQKLKVAENDILLLKGETILMGEKLRRTILKTMGKNVFVMNLKETSDIIKLSEKDLDSIGLQKKTE